MNIDWDEAVSEAKSSPRGILSEWLAREDEIQMIAITVVAKDGAIHTAWSWKEKGSSLYVLGMLESCKADIIRQQEGGTG